MRWEDERYVRLYTRDTPDWLALSFDAQALFALLLRKVDRAGLLPLGRQGQRAVAVVLGHPQEWARIEGALAELLHDGCVAVRGDVLVVPNYMEAQEAKASESARQRKARELARDAAAAAERLGFQPGYVTPRDEMSREPGPVNGAVTDCHATSLAVTPSLASLAEPKEEVREPPLATPPPAEQTEKLATVLELEPTPGDAKARKLSDQEEFAKWFESLRRSELGAEWFEDVTISIARLNALAKWIKGQPSRLVARAAELYVRDPRRQRQHPPCGLGLFLLDHNEYLSKASIEVAS